jgi:hypothetical protein
MLWEVQEQMDQGRELKGKFWMKETTFAFSPGYIGCLETNLEH